MGTEIVRVFDLAAASAVLSERQLKNSKLEYKAVYTKSESHAVFSWQSPNYNETYIPSAPTMDSSKDPVNITGYGAANINEGFSDISNMTN